MGALIHPTAIVDPRANLAADVEGHGDGEARGDGLRLRPLQAAVELRTIIDLNQMSES